MTTTDPKKFVPGDEVFVKENGNIFFEVWDGEKFIRYPNPINSFKNESEDDLE